MPPHVEWHVTDRDAPAVIVKTESRPPSRWRKWSIVTVIVIGAGLMAAYTSRPQTAAAPALDQHQDDQEDRQEEQQEQHQALSNAHHDRELLYRQSR